MSRHKVGTTGDVPEEGGLGIVVDGLEVAIFRVDGGYYAIQNRCPHKGGSMYKGTVNKDDCAVYCPWHAWKFDLESGDYPVDPHAGVRTFDVTIEGEEVYVEI